MSNISNVLFDSVIPSVYMHLYVCVFLTSIVSYSFRYAVSKKKKKNDYYIMISCTFFESSKVERKKCIQLFSHSFSGYCPKHNSKNKQKFVHTRFRHTFQILSSVLSISLWCVCVVVTTYTHLIQNVCFVDSRNTFICLPTKRWRLLITLFVRFYNELSEQICSHLLAKRPEIHFIRLFFSLECFLLEILKWEYIHIFVPNLFHQNQRFTL